MLLDLLFPRTCVGCGRLGTYLCVECMTQSRPVDPACLYCGKRSLMGLTHAGCRRREGIDGVVSLYRYGTVVQKAIKKIKYRLITDIFHELFHAITPEHISMVEAYKKAWPHLMLHPIPLHENRYKRRGFNQSDYIAAYLSTYTQFPVGTCLGRVKDTPPQALLTSPDARRQNVRGAFELRGPVPSQVMLVDDVLTTGNTAKECARILKQAGSNRVFIFTIARG